MRAVRLEPPTGYPYQHRPIGDLSRNLSGSRVQGGRRDDDQYVDDIQIKWMAGSQKMFDLLCAINV